MTSTLRLYLLLMLCPACHGGTPPGPAIPSAAAERREEAMTAALRWIPISAEYRGLPLVLMAGSAHGDFRPAWIDSLKSTRVIHHACTALTVAECADSARGAYVGLDQPRLREDRSADVTMTIIVMNPSACGRDTTRSSEVTGRLHMPWPGSSLRNYDWSEKKSKEASC